MKNSTLVHNLSPEDFKALLESIVEAQIEKLKSTLTQNSTAELLTRAEVAELLKCDVSTIHNWTVSGRLKSYGIGARIYYKRTEVEAAIIPLQSRVKKANP
jgi:excisionase family DNA binding protein